MSQPRLFRRATSPGPLHSQAGHAVWRTDQPDLVLRAHRAGAPDQRDDALQLHQHQRHPSGPDLGGVPCLRGGRSSTARPYRLAARRQGAPRARGSVAFLTDALALMPAAGKLRCVRADSGFFDNTLFSFLETRGIPYIVVSATTTNAPASNSTSRNSRTICRPTASACATSPPPRARS